MGNNSAHWRRGRNPKLQALIASWMSRLNHGAVHHVDGATEQADRPEL